jgi:hypothetical protein
LINALLGQAEAPVVPDKRLTAIAQSSSRRCGSASVFL